jgi:hypothetical protein
MTEAKMGETLVFITTVIELVLRHGVPAAIAIIKTLKDDEPVTPERILALKDLPPPESFFGGKPPGA